MIQLHLPRIAILMLLLMASAFPPCLGGAEEPPTVRIVLTFDDGPSAPEGGEPSTTLRVAEVLKRKALNGVADDIKAAFFVQTGIRYRGGSRRGLEVLRFLKDQGHVLGIHTGTVGGEKVDHLDHVQRQQQGKLGEDMDLAKARLLEAGVQAKYVRPTYGHFDAEVLKIYQSRGLKVILWDADSKDASEVRDPSAESKFRPANPTEVIETLKVGEDSVPHAIAEGNQDVVVLFHDISPTTAANLSAYIPTIRATASEAGGKKYKVEFVTRTADIEGIFKDRQDESDADEDVPPSPAKAVPAIGGQAPAPARGMTLWIVAGAGAAFSSGLAAALLLLRLRRRPTPGRSPELPVPALEALVHAAPLNGAQAACVVDCLQQLRPGDLDRIELAVYLLTVEAGHLPPGQGLTSGADGRAAQMAEHAGLSAQCNGHDQLTPRGIDRLRELKADLAEMALVRFVHARLCEPLEVTCPHCRTVQRSNWLRPILGCTHCCCRFALRDSPTVTPCPTALSSPAVADSGVQAVPSHAALPPLVRETPLPAAPVLAEGGRPLPKRRLTLWVRAGVTGTLMTLLGSGVLVFFQPPPPKPSHVMHQIIVDQFGYRPDGEKFIIFCWPQQGQFADLAPFDPGAEFQVRRQSDDAVVYTGAIRAWNGGATDRLSGDKAWQGEFSALTTAGQYYVSLPGGTNPMARSYDFAIREGVYAPVLRASTRMFFYQRCGMDLPKANAGPWYHSACHCKAHQDKAARLWDGAKGRPAGNPRDVHGGWHDAGDYSKYVEYLFDPLWDLMHAAEWYPAAFSDTDNIPESGNGVPDVLDEVKYELDWLLRMQQADGSVLGKVGVSDVEDDLSPPDRSSSPRYYSGVSTGATATAAAAFALGARVFRPWANYPGYADQLQAAAEKGWQFLAAHPDPIRYLDGGMGTPIREPDGTVLVRAEGSSDSNVSGPQERQLRLAAAAELFALTGKDDYRRYFDANYDHPDTTEDGHQPIRSNAFAIGRSDFGQRALVTYALAPGSSPAVVARIKAALKNGIERHLLEKADADPYRAYMDQELYNWTSNFRKASAGILPLWGVKLKIDPARSAAYLARAESYLHYFHGCNPLNLVYLSNMGPKGADAEAKKSVMKPYHSWFREKNPLYSGPDSTYGPAPGFVVGGPNAYYTGSSEPPKGEPPMKAYVDWNSRDDEEKAWEINEPQLAVQAAYTFLLAASCDPGGKGK